jgi:hypothetical protein
MRALVRLAVAVLVSSQWCGCGGDPGPKVYDVRGTVSLDGEPLAIGDVIFEATDGSSTQAGQIKDGAFAFQAQPGPKNVSIRASKKKYGAPGIGPRGENFILVRMIPKKYDLPENKLKADVKESNDESDNRFEFKLTTEP